MDRLIRRMVALAALGLVAGLTVAVLGVPYGRWSPSALAELYHGGTDTTGTFHLALDCDPVTAGTQSSCHVFASGISIAVTLGNSTSATANVAAFNFKVTNNRQDLFDPAIGVDANLNSNPDFNDAVAPTGWTCAPPPPERDEDVPNTAVSVSSFACFDTSPTASNAIPLLVDVNHVKVATVVYTGVGPIGPEQTATFTLSDVNIFDDTLTELMSCNPINTVAGPCFGATVGWGLPPPPTFPPTVTRTSTPSPAPATSTVTATPTGFSTQDTDGDGWPGNADNCPFNYNPGQENTDGNFISNAPLYMVDDTTRATSDYPGDVCDDDDDNDILLDVDEPIGCNGSAPLNPLSSDSDGDRFLDAAECILGSNPMSSASTPPIASCGAATDVDNDGLSARIELCRYNTDPNVADTDGDGVKDGCEAMSLNDDTIVNVADLGLLAAEILRAVPPASKLVNFDINKDGAFNPADQGLIAARVGKCP